MNRKPAPYSGPDQASLVAATLYLMSAYTNSRCPRLAIMIHRHLQLIVELDTATPLVRSTCAQLIERQWAAAEHAAREQLSVPAQAQARLH